MVLADNSASGNLEVSGAVCGHGARPAAVGDDRQALALRTELRGQRLGGIEQLADVLDAHDAGAAHGGVENDVGAAGHSRVRFDCRQPTGVATGLEQDDRLDARRRTQRAHEAAGVANAFDVEQDVMGEVVVDQVIEDFAEIDIGGAAQRDDAGKTDAVAGRPVEDRRADRSRLRDQRQIADIGVDAGKSRVESEIGADDAQTVRARAGERRSCGQSPSSCARARRPSGRLRQSRR
jgi:hypothetical protein